MSPRFSFLPLIMVAGLGLGRAADPGAPTLTLEKALASVEGANVTVLLGREAAAQALEQANQARVGILPNVGLSAQQRRTQAVTVTNGTATAGAPANRFDGKLTGNYSILNPQQLSAVRSARAGVEVAQADYKATVQSVLSSVAQVYFTHLRNLRRLDVLDANIARARSLYDLAVNQLNAGVATQIDVTRAEAQVEQTVQARLQQETSLYQSELLLKRLLDLPPADRMQLADFSVRRADARPWSSRRSTCAPRSSSGCRRSGSAANTVTRAGTLTTAARRRPGLRARR
ncbi:MAG: TolC family protein [Verrucomicrobia bacterium]|nr:TolC family protein [Verrucomicrobiota bacterium]